MELWTYFYKKRTELLFAFLIGLGGHFVKLITYLPTWDSMYGFNIGWKGMSHFGRWFSGISGIALGSSSDLQWVEGTVALFFLALTILTILEILDIQTPHIRFLAIALFLFFPSICGTMVYMLWVAPYAFAYFLAVYALYLCVKEPATPVSLILAVLCVTLSCGIYQIYITSAAIVFVYYLIKKLLNRNPIRSLFKTVFTTGAVFLFGVVIYFLIQKVVLRVFDIQLSDYQGISRVGEISLYSFCKALRLTFTKLILFYFGKKPLHIYFFLDAIVLSVVFVTWVSSIRMQKVGCVNTAFVIFLLATTPFLSYCLMFTTTDIHYHILMEGGNYFAYLGFLMLLDTFPLQKKRVSALGVVLIGLLCYYHFINNNTAYKQLEMSYQTTVYQSMDVLNRINSVDESAEIDTIAICGRWKSENPSRETTPQITGAR